MANLHNRVSQKELKERLYLETEKRLTLSFYKYTHIEDPVFFRDELYRGLDGLKVFGRIYIAHEGINAQVSVPQNNFTSLNIFLNTFSFLEDIRLNMAIDDDGKSFWVLKIKVRKKIVADGITDKDFDVTKKGKYVDARMFNEWSERDNTVVVDMRNHYEYEVGHFDKAIEIPSDTFREQLPMAAEILKDNKDKTIIMYCTGGIRCEKASAYMFHKGFKNVFHLEGGIINYVNQVKEQLLENKFIGKNFVFDDRLGERIGSEVISKCHQCGKACDEHTNCKNSGCHLLFIQCEECGIKYHGCCSTECKTIYDMPEWEQKEIRKGKMNGIMVFNKAKRRMKPNIK